MFLVVSSSGLYRILEHTVCKPMERKEDIRAVEQEAQERMSGEFQFTAGDVLTIIVGQQGTSIQTTGNSYGGGGGGGTFVFDQSGGPLIIAGGGGGASYQGNSGYGGSPTSSSVGGGYGQSSGGAGGHTDDGGGGGTGAGGGGLYANGTSNSWCNGGSIAGGAGGTSQNPVMVVSEEVVALTMVAVEAVATLVEAAGPIRLAVVVPVHIMLASIQRVVPIPMQELDILSFLNEL